MSEPYRIGDVVILSVRGSAAEKVLESAGLDSFDAKVLIDASDLRDGSKRSASPGSCIPTAPERRITPSNWWASKRAEWRGQSAGNLERRA